MKDKQGKLRWDLMPFGALDEVTKAFAEGAEKYPDWGWEDEPNAQQAYFAAAMRHLSRYAQGELRDQGSGLHPLAHVVADALIVMCHDLGISSSHLESRHSRRPEIVPSEPYAGPLPRPSGVPGLGRHGSTLHESTAESVRPPLPTKEDDVPSLDETETLLARHLID